MNIAASSSWPGSRWTPRYPDAGSEWPWPGTLYLDLIRFIDLGLLIVTGHGCGRLRKVICLEPGHCIDLGALRWPWGTSLTLGHFVDLGALCWPWGTSLTLGHFVDLGALRWPWGTSLTFVDLGALCWPWGTSLTLGHFVDLGALCWPWGTLLTLGHFIYLGALCWPWGTLLTLCTLHWRGSTLSWRSCCPWPLSQFDIFYFFLFWTGCFWPSLVRDTLFGIMRFDQGRYFDVGHYPDLGTVSCLETVWKLLKPCGYWINLCAHTRTHTCMPLLIYMYQLYKTSLMECTLLIYVYIKFRKLVLWNLPCWFYIFYISDLENKFDGITKPWWFACQA